MYIIFRISQSIARGLSRRSDDHASIRSLPMTTRLLVLEDEAYEYANAVKDHGLDDLEIIVSSAPEPTGEIPEVDVMLARPEYAAHWLEVMDAVKWIQSTWAGVNPLLDVTARKGIVLTGVKDIFGPLIAEYVLAYLLNEVRLTEHYKKEQQSKRWSQRWPDTLQGKTLMILGTGSIGSYLGRMAGYFGLNVIGVSRSGARVTGFDRVLTVEEFTGELPCVDYLACALPGTPETANLLNQDRLGALKAGAYLINVGRGSTVDHTALANLLENGHLAGALLDVFPDEPLRTDSPLWKTTNLAITPHIAAVSYPRDIARIFAENYRRYSVGEALLHQISVEHGY